MVFPAGLFLILLFMIVVVSLYWPRIQTRLSPPERPSTQAGEPVVEIEPGAVEGPSPSELLSDEDRAVLERRTDIRADRVPSAEERQILNKVFKKAK